VLFTEEGFNGGRLLISKDDTFEIKYEPFYLKKTEHAYVSSVYQFFEDYILVTHRNSGFKCRNKELYDYWFYAIVPDDIPQERLTIIPKKKHFIRPEEFLRFQEVFSKAKQPEDLLNLAILISFIMQDTPLNVFEVYEREGF